jgi:hypothetical protein
VPTLVFDLTRALGRAAIAFSSVTNVPLFKSGPAPKRPTTPVPPQRKQVGLAPLPVQSGTPREYNGAVSITAGSSGPRGTPRRSHRSAAHTYSGSAFVAAPFAHTWHTLRPSAATGLRPTRPKCQRHRHAVLARRTGGKLGVPQRPRMGKFG